jgi:hypothetical protein
VRIELSSGWPRGSLIIDDRGLEARDRHSTTHMAWQDIARYRFWSHVRRRSHPAHRALSIGQLTVFSRAGHELVIDQRYASLAEALDDVFAQLHATLANAASCAPFTLDDTNLVHASKGSLALADIRDVHLAGATLVVRRHGKLWPWAAEAMSNVDNVLVLVEKLADRGVLVRASEHSFLPLAVLDKVRATASRHTALPTATLVDHD